MASFTDYAVEAKFDGENWTRWNADIVSTIHGEYGIFSNSPHDYVGDIGRLTFELNNTETNSAGLVGYYSPGHPDCRIGFKPGLEVRMTFTMDSKVQKFIGTIPVDGIKVQSGKYSSRRVSVAVTDWFDQAGMHKITTLQFAQNKTFQQGVALVLANMPIQPPGTTTYHTGESTFKTLFDVTKTETTALSEFAKMANSELGYIYMTRQGLEVEGRMTRNDYKIALDAYPKARDDLAYLVNEDGDYLVTENAEKILISDSTNAIFDNSQFDADISYGTHYYNQVKFTAYPRTVDALDETILFNLASPTKIEAGETIVMTGRYSDPNGKYKNVNGIDMKIPVSGTHYLAFENEDGTGADLTANVSITASFGTSQFMYEIENTGASDLYLTKCTAEGRGIYSDDAVSYYVEDPAGILAYGGHAINLDMKYQDDAAVARRFAMVRQYQYSTLTSYVNSVSYHGSRRDDFLYAFIYIEPGDRIRIIEDVTHIVGSDYYVQGVKWDIRPSGTMDFTWIIKAVGMDTFHYAEWDGDGVWDDSIYGWDF